MKIYKLWNRKAENRRIQHGKNNVGIQLLYKLLPCKKVKQKLFYPAVFYFGKCYYFNIVGKYGAQVQALLKKAATLDINTICPLHGPILKENLAYYIGKYNVWSSYEPEDKGILVAYASIHGNTAEAAKKFAKMLEEAGAEKVAITDLSRDDMAEAVEDAFRYDRLVLAAAT